MDEMPAQSTWFFLKQFYTSQRMNMWFKDIEKTKKAGRGDRTLW
jgi:hypothetical protein